MLDIVSTVYPNDSNGVFTTMVVKSGFMLCIQVDTNSRRFQIDTAIIS